ncbi:MAG TPA: DUF4136 domain-containing protein [Chryseolinea sp.]|nr:DUF4136 domain-containing protein [Chryseolinea sp.]
MKHFLTASLILLLAGCYPQGPDYTEDTDVVYTTYDEKYEFQTKETYAMPDKIVIDVKIDRGDTTYEYMADKFAKPIFDKIDENMTALGYDRVSLDASPDLLLAPAALSSTTYFYSYWYDWWYGGYYGGWGWYYPPYYTVSSYTTGSLLMVISDPSQADDSPINRSQALWVSAANGLVNYSYDISRVTKSIDQSFKQSPYLTTK